MTNNIIILSIKGQKYNKMCSDRKLMATGFTSLKLKDVKQKHQHSKTPILSSW